MARRQIGAHLFSRFTACFALMITAAMSDDRCPPSSCGDLHNISKPFRLATDPEGCGYGLYELSCQNDKAVLSNCPYSNCTVYEELYDSYYVKAIDYRKYTIRLLSMHVLDGNYYKYDNLYKTETRFSKSGRKQSVIRRLVQSVTLLKCKKPVQNSSYIEGARNVSDKIYSYAVVGKNLSFSDLEESCGFELISLISPKNGTKLDSYKAIQKEISLGFELSYLMGYCAMSSPDYDCSRCDIDEDSNKLHCPEICGFMCSLSSKVKGFFSSGRVYFEILSVPRIVGVILVISLLAYKCKRQHLLGNDGIEEFLETNNLMPVRYSYWEIIVMTRGFSEKLGEGGFGSVYKGKLSSGGLVAVKMLNKSKANGQDFINEVATTGRIHHINVIELIGFCFTRSKRALIYKFMPNGSLDNYVFLREGITKLISHTELFEISLGVARGIEYLHRGCDMQILHFDIKPHNILLDDNFTPKVSDFGLARLCPLDKSTVQLTAARGTMGYIAPELFYKNIGHVSHKADVYSFGMLLMEMASRRRNLNAVAENSSQLFYPLWVYDRLNEDKDMTVENVAGEDLKTIKKMVIVALWCIQLKPCDRPSLNKVIEMLEGEVESLEMPPKPYLTPHDDNDGENQKAEEGTEESNVTSSPALSSKDSSKVSMVSDANLSL